MDSLFVIISKNFLIEVTLDQRFPYKESEEGTLWSHAARLFKRSDQSNYHIPLVESGLIGRSDEHRTQTTLKRAGCFDDKKIFALCSFGQSSSYQDSV